MAIRIDDTFMSSDQSSHTARPVSGRPSEWEVSWLPGRTVDRNTAVTAMVLAEIAASGEIRDGHRLWPHVQRWAEEVGLTGTDAMAQAVVPPRHPDRQHQPAPGRLDREATD
jgi:hypothetical protein